MKKVQISCQLNFFLNKNDDLVFEKGGGRKVTLTLGSRYFSRRQTLRVALSAFLCKKSASRSILWKCFKNTLSRAKNKTE